jgi:hypothetical protein
VTPNLDRSLEKLVSFFANNWYIKNKDDPIVIARIPVIAKFFCVLSIKNKRIGKKM